MHVWSLLEISIMFAPRYQETIQNYLKFILFLLMIEERKIPFNLFNTNVQFVPSDDYSRFIGTEEASFMIIRRW